MTMQSPASSSSIPDSALTREELYERIRKSSKQEVVLEEMQRLGFWPQDSAQPTIEAQLIRRESELQTALTKLGDELRGIEDRDRALKTMRKERMARARERREETRQRLAQGRHARAVAWHERRQRELLYVGDGVSGGLNEAHSDSQALARNALPALDHASDLAQAMGIGLGELRFLAWHREVSSVSHYQRFTMPKKSGGERHISAPMPRLKRAQYWVLDNILAKMPVHEAVHGFLPGRSILTNAAPHVGRDVVINLDLKDFFPSIGMRRVRGVFRQLGYSSQVASLLALVCTEAPTDEVQLDGSRYFVARGERVLPQGAPTSPMLTNLLCRRLDARLAASAAKLGFRYTRYADDLTFSAGPEHSRDTAKLLWRVKQIVASEGLTMHPDKQQVMRRHRQQHVTGIVVNDKLSVDRDTLRRFRAVLHQAERNGPQGLQWNGNSDVIGALRGYANFIAMTDAARGEPYLQRVRALAAKHEGRGTPAAPAKASQRKLAAGEFRKQSAAGQAPWPAWWQPAQASAPVLEKTAEQLAEEKKAQREAARPQSVTSAPATARPAAAAPRPAGQAPAQSPAPVPAFQLGWFLSVLIQAVYVLCAFEVRASPVIWLMTGSVVVANFVQRKPGWLRFIAAVFVSLALSSFVHGMEN
ncbi:MULTISPECIES: reverse transcriptase family protein [unclassified Variovorax]|jgi:retron-type reverse transcriptase|uniref:reverse transcriptase family protein n=1 Tax=unclassified Variovorax TaxID=663243 RepID=UPI000F7ED49C|nr:MULTISPECIES: reverse transcriptase family protein [unclassified Variovorax]RSZ39631.1 RNA-directed DNA polymerase [Variovorax sp. 553]RSZ40664.1 RNA-directed DNA polymerase [Variovorax sp. 679]